MCPFSILAFLQPTTVDKEPKNKKQKKSSAFLIKLNYLTHSPFPFTVYPPTVVLTARAPEPST